MMRNQYRYYPLGACAYIAMEQLLDRTLDDQKWLDHIQSRGGTNTQYLEIICSVYNCTNISYFIYYRQDNLEYNRISTPNGIYWLKYNEKVVVTHYVDRRKKVNCHTLTVPLYAIISLPRIHSLIVLNDSIVELDNSSTAIQEYYTVKGKTD